MKVNLPVTQNEVELRDDTLIVSRTDLKGQITYINKDFLDISGFSEDELIGKAHNMVRHPDMPPEAFADMWTTLKAGRPWTGYVKNRCKNGDFYWVLANATPIWEGGKVSSYLSVRRRASKAAIAAHEEVYRRFREKRQGSLVIRHGRAVSGSGWRENLGIRARFGAVTALVGAMVLALSLMVPDAATRTGLLLAVILAGAGLSAWTVGALRRDLEDVAGLLRAVSQGDYSSAVDISRNDDIGQVLQALQAMQTRSGFELADSARVADEMTQIKIGLDNVSTNVRIADNNGTLIYVNRALEETFRRCQAEFSRNDPSFDPKHIIGYDICRLYDDPEGARQRLRELQAPSRRQMKLGGRLYDVVNSPILNRQGERLGSIGEWVDVTDQVAAEAELADVIRHAGQGDFSHHLDMAGRGAFFENMGRLINELMDNSARGLHDVAGVLNALAAGDLTKQITAEYQGTFGEVKNDLNTTVSRLRGIVGRIQEAASSINVGAGEISAGNHDLSSRTEEQASSLEETAASMEQLNATVKQNSENSCQAQLLADRSNEVAGSAGDTMRQVAETMGGIQSSSRRIADIVGMIDGIAFQTNILALNASVEAARAGDAGRGFAVVATEVRNLAQRSAQAAKEIRGLIAESARQVGDGVDLVEEAGATMDEVVRSCRSVAALIAEISNASREQSQGIGQITLAVSQMDEVTQQNAALVEEAAAAAESLKDQARGLIQAVAIFDTGERTVDDGLVLGLDFPGAMRAHSDWRKRLVDYISGAGEKLDAATVECDDRCALGKWIYGDARQLAHVPVFESLRGSHAHFHQCAGKVIRCFDKGDGGGARALLAGDFATASRATLDGLRALRDQCRDLPPEETAPAPVPVRQLTRTPSRSKPAPQQLIAAEDEWEEF